MTTPGTTDGLATAAEDTAAEDTAAEDTAAEDTAAEGTAAQDGTAEDSDAGAALAAGLDAVARLHADALRRIAHLAETWDQPDDGVRVLRRAELPTLTQRVEAAAA